MAGARPGELDPVCVAALVGGGIVAAPHQAIDADHEIIPVLNKIDLPSAEPDRIRQQIEDVVGIDAADALVKAEEFFA